MPVHFEEILARSGNNTVRINISGLDGDGSIDENRIKLHVYAYNSQSGQAIFNVDLNINQLRHIYSYLDNFSIVKDSNTAHTTRFVEADGDLIALIEQIRSVDPELVAKIFEKMQQNDRIIAVLENFSQEDLAHLEAARKQVRYKSELENLSRLMDLEASDPSNFCQAVESDSILNKYAAGQPERIFQNWIESNLWAIDGSYIKKHDRREISLTSQSDLILETTDGFIDLIELKRPKAALFKHDTSHDCYYPSPELSLVLGQSLHYLKSLDEFKSNLERAYKVKVLKPRILIFLGRSNEFDDQQFETLRMLNSNLNHIHVFSFDYILSNGQKIIKYYESDDVLSSS